MQLVAARVPCHRHGPGRKGLVNATSKPSTHVVSRTRLRCLIAGRLIHARELHQRQRIQGPRGLRKPLLVAHRRRPGGVRRTLLASRSPHDRPFRVQSAHPSASPAPPVARPSSARADAVASSCTRCTCLPASESSSRSRPSRPASSSGSGPAPATGTSGAYAANSSTSCHCRPPCRFLRPPTTVTTREPPHWWRGRHRQEGSV